MLKSLEIDKFLCKDDLIQCLILGLVWPWSSTHFIKRTSCFNCGFLLDNNIPLHFQCEMNTEKIFFLLNSPHFWCQSCEFAIYDHYPEDECKHCYNFELTK